MITKTHMTALETTIVGQAQEALKRLQSFELDTLSLQDVHEASDLWKEANTLIQLALFESGLSEDAGQALRKMEPLVTQAYTTIAAKPEWELK